MLNVRCAVLVETHLLYDVLGDVGKASIFLVCVLVLLAADWFPAMNGHVDEQRS